MLSTSEIQKAFLSQPNFAVVGAHKDQAKWGTKVLKWYKARNKPVTPVHNRESELEDIPTVKSLADLPSPQETAVSIITAPPITLNLLQQSRSLSIPVLWLQPGAEDATVISYIHDNSLQDKVIYGGPCILVDGDGIIKSLL